MAGKNEGIALSGPVFTPNGDLGPDRGRQIDGAVWEQCEHEADHDV